MNASKDGQKCHFCSVSEHTALEEHHIIPQRHGGSDEPENLVMLCGSCHNKIERLYDQEFYSVMACSESDRGGQVNTGTGRRVDATQSKDRMIPPDSPHIQVEQLKFFPAIDSKARKFYDEPPQVRGGGSYDLRETFPDNYRIHCSYCHTVFTRHEHADAARHLRVRHGIDNPYEEQDTHHFSPEAPKLTSLTDGDSQ